MLIYDEKKKQSLRICCMTNQTMVDEDHHVVALVDDVVSDDDPDNLERKVNETRNRLRKHPPNANPKKKKTRRSKSVPPDYVCSACRNKHTPTHLP